MKVRFPAIQAMIGKRRYYATTMALSEVPRFFKFNDWGQVDPSLRAQRVLNSSRIPEIVRYIQENEEGYIFSSITASYRCPVTFTPIDGHEQMGTIEMDLESMEFIINDGQHRAAAIAAAIKENPDLGKEQISVLLFETEGLDRLQQMFSDLNRFVHKTSKSLDILYDHRDAISTLTKDMTEMVPAFRGMIDMEKMSMPLRSPKLVTLSALYDANTELLGEKVDVPGTEGYKRDLQKVTDYWTEVSKVIPDWQSVQEGKVAAPMLRQEKINTHGIVLRALGVVGNSLFEYRSDDWQSCLAGMRMVDWRKSVGGRVNPLWDNICIVAGSVVSNRQARIATQAVLKDHLGLPLGNQERQVIANLRDAGWKGTSQASKSAAQQAPKKVAGSVA